MRRLLFAVVALFAVMTPAHAFATDAPPNSSGDAAAVTTTSIVNSFLDTKRDISQCLGNSVGLPDCGTAPTQPGDRGGALQIVTFSLLALGIVIISWRVVRSVRARDAALGSRPG
jgi:hypothetical protein